MSDTRTPRDSLRRALGQNLLVDQTEINGIIEAAGVEPGDLILEIGAGSGALTLPPARAGARVVAVEPDPVWARHLHVSVRECGFADRVEMVRADFRSVRLRSEP